MVILSCLLLLVSLHSQNVEIVCLTLQYSNYVGRICHLCWLCSKLMFFKRSTVYCSKSTYAHQTSQKKLASDLVIQIIPPKVLQECTTILQLKVFIVYVVQKLVGHPPQYLSIWPYSFFYLSALQDLWTISFFYFFPHEVLHHKVRKVVDPSF